MQLPNIVAPSNVPLHPQLPVQPITNPNNKAVQQFEISNMPAYSITPIQCNELSRRVVEPIVIEDVPSPMTEEGMNKKF